MEQQTAVRLPTRLLIGFILVIPSILPAAAESDAGLWATGIAGANVTDRWGASLAVQSRYYNDIGTLERIVLRPSLDYRLDNRSTITAGYDAHLFRDPLVRLEQRLWQQGSRRWQLGNLGLVARLRLEERFIEDASGTAVRLRLLQRVSRNLGQGGWYVAASNEVFYSINGLVDGPDKGFDQIRLYAGAGRSLSSAQAEFGYQMQYINRSSTDLVIHQLMFSLRF